MYPHIYIYTHIYQYVFYLRIYICIHKMCVICISTYKRRTQKLIWPAGVEGSILIRAAGGGCELRNIQVLDLQVPVCLCPADVGGKIVIWTECRGKRSSCNWSWLHESLHMCVSCRCHANIVIRDSDSMWVRVKLVQWISWHWSSWHWSSCSCVSCRCQRQYRHSNSMSWEMKFVKLESLTLKFAWLCVLQVSKEISSFKQQVWGSEVRVIEVRDIEVRIIVCPAGVKGNIVIRTASGGEWSSCNWSSWRWSLYNCVSCRCQRQYRHSDSKWEGGRKEVY